MVPSRRLLASVFALLICAPLAACGGGGLVDDVVGAPPPGGSTSQSMSQGEQAFADEVFRLVNEQRVANNLAPLQWEDTAADAAFGHSVDMAVRGYFSHVSPEGRNTGDRLNAAGGGGWRGWGENIAEGQRSPQEVMTAWMNSQGHRENILRATFTHLGVGVYAPGSSIWWTQVFVVR